MIELGESTGLGQIHLNIPKARDPLGIGHLDCHRAIEVVVMGKVNAPETSLAETPHDAIAANLVGIARLSGG